MTIKTTTARILGLALLAPLALLAGCATSFHALNVEAPPATPASTTRAQAILIRNVTDARVFEDHPAQPGTPSLAEETEEIAPGAKARAIGRVRDGFGKARGNVLLPAGRSVEDLVRQTLLNALTGMGYQIETDENAISSNDIVMDVTIDKFWGWVDVNGGGGFAGPGAMFMSGELATTLKTTGPIGKKMTLNLAAKYRRQLRIGVTPGNWLALYRELLYEYAGNTKKTLNDLPKP